MQMSILPDDDSLRAPKSGFRAAQLSPALLPERVASRAEPELFGFARRVIFTLDSCVVAPAVEGCRGDAGPARRTGKEFRHRRHCHTSPAP